MPSARSIPPPNGSRSTSSVKVPRAAAVRARPAASVVAPAPPRPPTTHTTGPCSPPGSCSTSRPTSQSAADGSSATWLAPTSAARSHNRSAAVPTTTTPGRRGSFAAVWPWSVPSNTVDATGHAMRTAVSLGATTGLVPAAAQSRSRSSRSGCSDATIKGRPAGSVRPGSTRSTGSRSEVIRALSPNCPVEGALCPQARCGNGVDQPRASASQIASESRAPSSMA